MEFSTSIVLTYKKKKKDWNEQNTKFIFTHFLLSGFKFHIGFQLPKHNSNLVIHRVSQVCSRNICKVQTYWKETRKKKVLQIFTIYMMSISFFKLLDCLLNKAWKSEFCITILKKKDACVYIFTYQKAKHWNGAYFL